MKQIIAVLVSEDGRTHCFLSGLIRFVEILGKSKLTSVFIHRTVLTASGINGQLIARHLCG